MTDELKKDWRKKMEEREAEEKALEAEHQKKMRSYQRWDIVLNCLWAVTIAWSRVALFLAAFELGWCIGERVGKKHDKPNVIESTAVETTSTPRIVPDDIYKGYAMVAGVEVPRITKDSGLTPPPVRYFRGPV